MATCTKPNNETNPSPKNDFKLTLETVMVIGLGHAKPWTMISIKGTSPITKLQESPLLKKNSRQRTSTNSNSSLSGPLWPSEMLVFEGPSSFDDLTLSLVDSKKQMDNDGLAITGITWIVIFALHWGLVGCNICNKGLGGSKSNIQSAGSPNVSVD